MKDNRQIAPKNIHLFNNEHSDLDTDFNVAFKFIREAPIKTTIIKTLSLKNT